MFGITSTIAFPSPTSIASQQIQAIKTASGQPRQGSQSPNPVVRGGSPTFPQHVSGVTAILKKSSDVATKATITFQRPVNDGLYVDSSVYVSGYQGNPQPVKVASGQSPISVALNNTGESLAFTVQANGPTGSAPLSSAPTTTAKLVSTPLATTPTTTGTGAGVTPYTSPAHQWINAVSASVGYISSQPAFSDISGSVAASQLPSPTATTLGGVKSTTAVAHQFLTALSTAGVFSQAQPAFTDISGTATSGQYVAMVGDSGSGGTQGAVPAPAAGTAAAGKYLKADGTWAVPPGSGGGSGTVTSVGLGADSGAILVSSGGPVTSSGTLQLQFSNETANTVLAGPVSGSAATPTFRALTAADIPSAAGITSPATAGFREDFLGWGLINQAITVSPNLANGDTTWLVMSLGGTTNTLVSSPGTFLNPGQLTFTTLNVSADGMVLYKGGDSASGGASVASLGALGSNAGWELHFIAKLSQTTLCAMRLGVVAGGSENVAAPTNGIWIEYDTSNASSSTDFTWVTASAASTNYSTTNAIAVDTNFHHFRIRSTVAGTIGFSVDGGTEATVSTDVPTVALGVFITLVTRTGTAKSCVLDFVSYSASTGRT